MILFNSKTTSTYKKGSTKRRSVFKAVTWRILASIDTFLISYLLTGNVGIAASIGGLEIVTKVFLYFIHERIWNQVAWGKRKLQ